MDVAFSADISNQTVCHPYKHLISKKECGFIAGIYGRKNGDVFTNTGRRTGLDFYNTLILWQMYSW
jgi:hypothetical protein